MLVVEPRGWDGGNEELRPICPWSSVCHRQGIWPVVPILWTELVFKVSSPTTFSASPVSKGITSLQHKLLDDSVEDDIVVVPVIDVGDKVLDCLWGGFWE